MLVAFADVLVTLATLTPSADQPPLPALKRKERSTNSCLFALIPYKQLLRWLIKMLLTAQIWHLHNIYDCQ